MSRISLDLLSPGALFSAGETPSLGGAIADRGSTGAGDGLTAAACRGSTEAGDAFAEAGAGACGPWLTAARAIAVDAGFARDGGAAPFSLRESTRPFFTSMFKSS